MSITNDYAVIAELTVAATNVSDANTAANTAFTDMNTALSALSENVSISFGKKAGQIQWTDDVPDGQGFSVQGQLTIGASSQGSAQSVAEAAATAINTAIASISPAVTVTLQQELGQYVFAQL